MLKPQQQRGELLLRDSPPVFGKPWYWQRSSGTMESTRSLAQVIMEMRDEIKKLEAENRELRGDHGQRPFGGAPGEDSPVSSAAEQRAAMEENPYVNLRRNASAPVLEGQYKGERKLHRWLLSTLHLFVYFYYFISILHHRIKDKLKEHSTNFLSQSHSMGCLTKHRIKHRIFKKI